MKKFKKFSRLLDISGLTIKSFFFIVLLGIISSYFSMYPIAYLGSIANKIQVNSTQRGRNIILYLLAYFGLVVCGSVIRNIFCFLVSRLSNKIIYKIRNELFSKLLRINNEFLDKSNQGDIQNTVFNNTARLDTIFSSSFFTLFSDLLDIFWILYFICQINAGIVLILLAGVPILILWGIKAGKFQRELARKKIKSEKSLISYILQSYRNIQTIRVYGGEGKENIEFDRFNSDNYKVSNKSDLTLSVFFISEKTLRMLFICSSLAYFVFAANNDVILLGNFLVIVMYSERFYSPITNIIKYLQMIQKGLESLDDIFSFIDECDNEPFKNISWHNKNNLIVFEDVEIKMGKDFVRSGINFYIRDNCINILKGSSGSGKTTLIKTILGIKKLAKGQMYFSDNLMNNVLFSYEEQDISLFQGTIIENIIYPLSIDDISAHRLDDIYSYARDLGISDEMLNREIDLFSDEISGGEKKKIAFLRAMYYDCRIVILDEITANLDMVSKRNMEDKINELCKSKAVILISHDQENYFDKENTNIIDFECLN